MNDPILPAERGVSNRVVFKCELADARSATRILRTFLAEQGLDEAELFQCEVCLAEACNNAVQYAPEEAVQSPVVAEAICHGGGVELRVTDHTHGFELQEKPTRIDPRRESGRGLFIIQSFMDDVRYYRAVGRNTLVMRKNRTRQQHRPEQDAAVATVEDARRQIESCQQTISGMARELCVRTETLAAIFRCSAELGRTSDLEGFGRRLLGDLLHLTAADWFVLRLVPVGESRLMAFASSDSQLRTDALPLNPATESAVPAETAAALFRRAIQFESGTTVCANDPLRAIGPDANGLVQPVLFGETLVGTLAIGRNGGVGFSALEAEVIRTFAEFMAVQVMNARQLEDQMHARIVAHELDIAHGIQRALLPRRLPQLPGFTLAASWECARQVGGDFYDALILDASTVLLVVADVMGKGVPAAMFATIMRSLLRALVGRSRQPARLLKRLNELLFEQLSSVGMFITVQLVVVDIARRETVVASAGHCPILVTSAGQVQPLRLAGTPLGVLPNATYRQETLPLIAPAGLLLYTDGITEAQSPAGEMFGAERLLQWLRDRTTHPAGADLMRDELAAEIERFCGSEPLRDDQAFLMLRENPAAQPGPATATTGDFLLRDPNARPRQFIFRPARSTPS
ncbi:MAG TPA: SpoIIE family protein phosphatase [Opitutaceae bacterium]|nr:SpoIIE family protein phosphatase [Opitutaceae bacterium]